MITVTGESVEDQTPFVQAAYTASAKLEAIVAAQKDRPEGMQFDVNMGALLVDEHMSHDELCWVAACAVKMIVDRNP